MKRITKILPLVLLLWSPLLLGSDNHRDNFNHGNKQVEKMLLDRPEMAQFITLDGSLKKLTRKDSIWQWAAKAYEERVNDSVIEWDNSELSGPLQYMSDHTIPQKGFKGLIRLREVFRDSQGKIRNATFGELWSACIFELINIKNAESFLNVYHRALRDEISKNEWVRLNTRLEHQALIELKAFFRDNWKPWSLKNNYKYEPRNWSHDTPNDYEKWIAQYQRSKNNPYGYWENYYDTKIAPYLRELKEYKKRERSNNSLQRTLILLNSLYAESIPDGYSGAKFGMSYHDVKKMILSEGLNIHENITENDIHIQAIGQIMNRKALFLYYFTPISKKLIFVSVFMPKDIYKKFKNNLIKQYGNPYKMEDSEQWLFNKGEVRIVIVADDKKFYITFISQKMKKRDKYEIGIIKNLSQ